MWSLSVHLRGISAMSILCLLVWSTLCLSRAGQVEAAAEVHHASDNKVDQELLLTREEKMAFDKFKAAVYNNISFAFLKQDLYLLRWIRAKNLDADVAIHDMFEYLEFLHKNRVTEHILHEDWSDMKEDHPFHFDALDREGRPVIYASVGEGWNIRRTILQGKRQRFMRYTYYLVWELMSKFMDINKEHPNVTQCLILMNMQNFNIFEHSCPECITAYITLLDVYERYVPGYVKDIVVINAPQAYLILLEVLRPVLSTQTRKSLRVFGTNKNKWKPYIDARVDPNQLPSYFGGTKPEKMDF